MKPPYTPLLARRPAGPAAEPLARSALQHAVAYAALASSALEEAGRTGHAGRVDATLTTLCEILQQLWDDRRRPPS